MAPVLWRAYKKYFKLFSVYEWILLSNNKIDKVDEHFFFLNIYILHNLSSIDSIAIIDRYEQNDRWFVTFYNNFNKMQTNKNKVKQIKWILKKWEKIIRSGSHLNKIH